MKFSAIKEGGGANLYVKLEKDGDSIVGVFAGEPIDYKDHYQLGPCTGPGCAFCKTDPKEPQFRFKINFIVVENGMLVPKIFQQGWTTYKKMASLAEEYDLTCYWIKIKRNGTGKDTKYDLIPVAKGEITGDKLRQVQAVKLHDLKVSKARKPQDDGPPPFAGGYDAPQGDAFEEDGPPLEF